MATLATKFAAADMTLAGHRLAKLDYSEIRTRLSSGTTSRSICLHRGCSHGRITPLQHPYRDVATVKHQVTIDPASNVK